MNFRDLLINKLYFGLSTENYRTNQVIENTLLKAAEFLEKEQHLLPEKASLALKELKDAEHEQADRSVGLLESYTVVLTPEAYETIWVCLKQQAVNFSPFTNPRARPILRRYEDEDGNKMVVVAEWFYEELVGCLPEEDPVDKFRASLIEEFKRLKSGQSVRDEVYLAGVIAVIETHGKESDDGAV